MKGIVYRENTDQGFLYSQV